MATPHEEKWSVEPSLISWASAHFYDCVTTFTTFYAKPAQKGTDKKVTVAREVLCKQLLISLSH